MTKFVTVLLLAVVLLQALALYHGYQRQDKTDGQLVHLQQQVTLLEQRLVQQEAQIRTLEEQSVSAMVDKANTVIVEGWDAIVDSVENEMEKAQQALRQMNSEGAAETQ